MAKALNKQRDDQETSSNELNASPSFIAEEYQRVRCSGRSKVMKCDMLHTCLWYQSALARGLWKFLEDVWVVWSTSGQLLTGIKSGGIPGVAAQMAAHRGFSAISRKYQYQLCHFEGNISVLQVTKPTRTAFVR